jgi:hypothetical protein
LDRTQAKLEKRSGWRGRGVEKDRKGTGAKTPQEAREKNHGDG